MLMRILREDGQRMILTIQPQYIPVQDISLSIGISDTMGVSIIIQNILVHNRSRVHFTVTDDGGDHTNDGTSRTIGEDVEH